MINEGGWYELPLKRLPLILLTHFNIERSKQKASTTKPHSIKKLEAELKKARMKEIGECDEGQQEPTFPLVHVSYTPFAPVPPYPQTLVDIRA